MPTPISAIILAGGRSKRLGVDKTRLTLGRDGTLLEQTCRKITSLADETIVVGAGSNHQYISYDNITNLRWLPDRYPDAGALGGMLTGMERALNEYCLLIAADMPFISCALLKHMVELPRYYDVLVPSFQEYVEPLHAIYSKRCIEPMVDMVSQSLKRIVDFYPQMLVQYMPEEEVRRFDPELRSFFNINTTEQLAKAWVIELSR